MNNAVLEDEGTTPIRSEEHDEDQIHPGPGEPDLEAYDDEDDEEDPPGDVGE